MKNHAAATVRNRILKGAALCGVLALSMTLTGCFVPPDDLSGDLSNQGVVYNTVAVTAPPRTATSPIFNAASRDLARPANRCWPRSFFRASQPPSR